MATGDFYVKDNCYNALPVKTWQVQPSATGINPGEPVIVGATGSGFVVAASSSQPLIGVSGSWIGLATKAGTHTSSVAGLVDVQYFMPGVVYSGKALIAANVNTAAKILALEGKRVLSALVSGVFTVDTAVTDANTNGLIIVGGNATTSEVYFIVRIGATYLGNVA